MMSPEERRKGLVWLQKTHLRVEDDCTVSAPCADGSELRRRGTSVTYAVRTDVELGDSG